MKPETKSGSTVPENRSDAEASASAVKDGNNPAPASKAPVSYARFHGGDIYYDFLILYHL